MTVTVILFPWEPTTPILKYSWNYRRESADSHCIGRFLCEHRISTGRGLLIQNKSHLRDRTTALDQLQDSLDEQLECRATEFLQRIRAEKSRYARDQFRLLQSLLDRYGVQQMLRAISSAWTATCAVLIQSGTIWSTGQRKRQRKFPLSIRHGFRSMIPSTISPLRSGIWISMQRLVVRYDDAIGTGA